MTFLVFYDISNNRIRTKVAKRLLAFGFERIQLSVFCGLYHPKSNKVLWKELETLLATEQTAKFYVVKTSKKQFKNMDFLGSLDWDINYLLGCKNTLFI